MNREMTIRDIAGFCPEEAVWKMMADTCEFLLNKNDGNVLTPDSIVIDRDHFLVEKGHSAVSEFLAPEQIDGQKPDDKQMVWSLGAVAFFMATGHVVFGGHGGCYQKESPSVQLPVLPKGLQTLTSVLHRCMCYTPGERICLKELKELLEKELDTCHKQQRKRLVQATSETRKKVITNGEKWPEEMIEI